METRSSKRKRLLQSQSESQTSVDRITHLPDDVLHRILLLLPIKTVAQTAVLSKRWRALWSSFPDLDFTTIDPHCVSCLCFNPSGGTADLPRALSAPANPSNLDCITQTLAGRQKGADIRVLRFQAHLGFSRLNGLIRTAIRHNVKELHVDVCTEDYFNVPRCVVMSECLKALSLKFRPPGFRLPPSLVMKGGFQSLQTLTLSHMVSYKKPYLLDLFSGSTFPVLRKLAMDSCCGMKFLDVGCRALEDLTVRRCFQLDGLTVSCPRLERLKVESCFESPSEKSWVKIMAPRLWVMNWDHNAITEKSSLESLESMEEASVGFFAMNEATSLERYKSVSNFLSGLSQAHSLTIQAQCIQILSNNDYSTISLPPFHNLTTLKLQTLLDKNNTRGILCLFRSSPILHTLYLKILVQFKAEKRKIQAWNKELWDHKFNSEEEQYWESRSHTFRSFLQHLKVVKMEGLVETETEIGLIKFLLKHGAALQEMTLRSGHCNSRDPVRRNEIRSRMMRFSWASPTVELAFR